MQRTDSWAPGRISLILKKVKTSLHASNQATKQVRIVIQQHTHHRRHGRDIESRKQAYRLEMRFVKSHGQSDTSVSAG